MRQSHYGQAIKGLRVARDLTAEQLGQKCDPEMSGHQIRWIEGQQSIQLHKLNRVCDGLGIKALDVLALAETFEGAGDAEPT